MSAILQPAPVPVPASTVTLESCDREPIHIPGAIQPHGLLLAFDRQQRLCHRSLNAAHLLETLPELGAPLAARHFGGHAGIHRLLEKAFGPDAEAELLPLSGEVDIGEARYDLILHQAGDLLVAEFERRGPHDDALASFALKAHRVMDRLKRQRSIDSLLRTSVEGIRQLTGFDRVMAYRFRPDGSGEVAAEALVDTLEPFYGRRYPASDIPAQARRLYLANTLRTIVDVGAVPVAVEGLESAGPLDMSHAVLRAVSPIHLEYLGNMGVNASMSISIVVQDKLWGMIACHHMSPRQVPYAERMACDVIAQILAANVQTLLARSGAERIAFAATLRARVVEDLLHSEDAVGSLAAHAGWMMQVFDAHAVVVCEGSKLSVEGDVPAETARALARWLAGHRDATEPLIALDAATGFPQHLQPMLDIWCGMLALHFDPSTDSWLILLRMEQVKTINWGGQPDKEYRHGPNGPRLTPRGSFSLWREIVHGTTEPWDETSLAIARQMVDEMGRATASRASELSRARNQLLAVLGHDLRDPLHSISMAARVLEKTTETQSGRIGQRIQSSSSRMQRLVGQVLDMSRLQGGLGLGLHFADVAIAPLIRDLVDEASVAHPGIGFALELDDSVSAEVDADRLAQVITNLASNARLHGVPGEPITVRLSGGETGFELQVRNVGKEIPGDLAATLFNPFKRQSLGNERNRTGLGLGLYIAHEIVQSHGGRIAYSFQDPQVVFSVTLPRRQPLQPDPVPKVST